MFTGIVTDIGEVIALEQNGDMRARIQTRYDADDIDLGASIACNGVCLTVIEKGKLETHSWFDVEISSESQSITNIGSGNKAWKIGTKLNLERALKLGDELGGHMVSGHVDGLADLVQMDQVGDSTVVTFETSDKLSQFIAEKGSVTLDGTSLTVNQVDGSRFNVNLIPHTKTCTIWGDMALGDKINLEIDTLARYVARLAQVREAKPRPDSFKSDADFIDIAGQASKTT
ncbi:riboflavin synthase subunit alpha [Amylibacter marinus]|uniref:Riboflavin synthase n=1 Tax=Amylibacter marinus TaxID=1475483 RepID=A0ABQ5VTB6_9RHOB|nr:riboflavin synthase [Amylibacter marinus]GLQ34677.1 riboflavin synthase subunit alpha [Amylibacter marinus]